MAASDTAKRSTIVPGNVPGTFHGLLAKRPGTFPGAPRARPLPGDVP
jgi:hypothetical protein